MTRDFELPGIFDTPTDDFEDLLEYLKMRWGILICFISFMYSHFLNILISGSLSNHKDIS